MLLRWFPSFALRISIAHDFCVISARKWARARQNVRDFPQTELDSEINARFLFNEHSDPHFLFYKFNENNTLNNWEKIGRNLWLLFWQMKQMLQIET